MKIAIEEAFKGMRKNEGGPFGALVVKNGKIIARAHNEVIKTKDPTAHAEILAIRRSCTKLKRFDLSGCEIYSSCEPCPMCLAAIYWARIKKIHYGCTRDDATKIGFDDKLIYDFIKNISQKKQIKKKKLHRKDCLKPFKEWELKKDRVRY